MVPREEQLITPPASDTWILLWGSAGKQNVRRWLIWPEVDTLKTLAACRNRAEIASFDKDAKRVGTKSPEGAGIDATNWIREIVKSQFVPADLENRMLAVQEASPQDSLMVCRWTVDGTSLQVIQSVARVGVVIKPKQEWRDATNDGEEFTFFLIDRVLNHGKEMVSWGAKPGVGFPDELKLFVPKTSAPGRASLNWWGHPVWYTDGKAMAVILEKQLDHVAHNPSPTEPWF
ncbi:MAG: hypothetical protein U1E05_25460 [Patescibacteria group bacterium]|nr:hypothetical protein [Patescibacteria group bacterium]